jgi:hypothetical protein
VRGQLESLAAHADGTPDRYGLGERRHGTRESHVAQCLPFSRT